MLTIGSALNIVRFLNMTSALEKMLCLAMTVLGPLTVKTPPSTQRRSAATRHAASGDGGLRSLLGRSVYSIFSSVEWSTLIAMTSVFGTVEHCLRWLGMNFPIPDEEMPYIIAGARVMKEWETETTGTSKDLENLRQELEKTRSRCHELAKENDGLRQRCAAYSEAGLILEQDRQQLQSLLSDKCKLLEENQHLEREISSLQELLDYATEHAVEEEDNGFDCGAIGFGEDEGFDGEVNLECDDSLQEFALHRTHTNPLLDDVA